MIEKSDNKENTELRHGDALPGLSSGLRWWVIPKSLDDPLLAISLLGLRQET